MNLQPARLARWFHRHAVLPSRTVRGIEVVCLPTRAQLDSCLEELAGQTRGQLKVWVAHFDDGADVVWDQNASPIGNWRSQFQRDADVDGHLDLDSLSPRGCRFATR
jgi:hypothetical protein